MPTKSVLTKSVEDIERVVETSLQKYLIDSPTWTTILANLLSETLTSVTTKNKHLCSGMLYKANYTAEVATGSNLDIAVTSSGKRVHFFVYISTQGFAKYYTYEGATITGGTPVPSYNMERNFPTNALTTIKHSPTVDLTGSQVLSNGILITGGNTLANRVGGIFRIEDELAVLRINTTYLFRISNIGNAKSIISFVVEYWECE